MCVLCGMKYIEVNSDNKVIAECNRLCNGVWFQGQGDIVGPFDSIINNVHTACCMCAHIAKVFLESHLDLVTGECGQQR